MILRASIIITDYILPTSNKLTTQNQEENDKKNNEISLFMIKILLIDNFVSKKNQEKNIIKQEIQEINNPEELGKLFGSKLWSSRKEVKNNKSLEFFSTIHEYYEAFLKFLTLFLSGFIFEIMKKKITICNWQRKHRKKTCKTISSLKITKIVTFMASIFTNIAFPSYNIWLPSILTSLGQKPKLISSLHQFLKVCHVMGHTERHERNKEKDHMDNIIIHVTQIPNNLGFGTPKCTNY
ncbi:hypothetical protein Glove_460g66 [Diversispora epigaea]|uniref:Uncharacterized protein n=1 Tax=Diversispora epigaea TaxID=1348612 RepID=A0A397GSG7_9GLOM|nr:hypothetical protein Glove_460g66 [Diversispora epigaea]